MDVLADPTGHPRILAVHYSGKPAAGEVMFSHRFVRRGWRVPAALAESSVQAHAAATASAVVSLRRNGVQFGTATFGAGGTAATLAAAAQTDFAVSDLLEIVAPSPADATLAGVRFGLVGFWR